MNIIQNLAASLAELTHLQTAHALGLLRLSVKDAGLNPDTPLSYEELRDIVQVQMRKRLDAIRVANSHEVVGKMLVALNEKQSLLSMTAR